MEHGDFSVEDQVFRGDSGSGRGASGGDRLRADRDSASSPVPISIMEWPPAKQAEVLVVRTV